MSDTVDIRRAWIAKRTAIDFLERLFVNVQLHRAIAHCSRQVTMSRIHGEEYTEVGMRLDCARRACRAVLLTNHEYAIWFEKRIESIKYSWIAGIGVVKN